MTAGLLSGDALVMEDSAPEFRARAKVAKGKFPLRTNEGSSVTISHDRLTLLKRKGDVIADMPVSGVRAASRKSDAGGSVRIWSGEDTYILDWTSSPDGSKWEVGPSTAGGVFAKLPRKRALTTAFLDVVAAHGGRVDGREAAGEEPGSPRAG